MQASAFQTNLNCSWVIMKNCLSLLQEYRKSYVLKKPRLLQQWDRLIAVPSLEELGPQPCASSFPMLSKQPSMTFIPQETPVCRKPLKVGVVFSGGQAPGGHNVISGVFDALFDALAARQPGSELIGFLEGPKGIIEQKWKVLDAETINLYRNMGGFDMIGSGRTKIETPEQFAAARAAVQNLDLDGLIIIGGDDSNTNAAWLAENFLAHHLKTKVCGVPKTIDGDLKNQWIETSFGFDTACKTYAATIGSLARDALSAKKYYYFIKLMGRSASHIALECALQTHPNLVLIAEEILDQKKSLDEVVQEIANVICLRSESGKDYGIILIPEGILEFISDCRLLIEELNGMLIQGTNSYADFEALPTFQEKNEYLTNQLSPAAQICYLALPSETQGQLLLERDSHGNVQVSKIETERLFIQLVEIELQKRKRSEDYTGSFSPQPHFCGYEGRCCLPSNFDAHYCYALGYTAVLLIDNHLTGYLACLRGLAKPVEDWTVSGIPLLTMMDFELRKGKQKPVIKKALVNLEGSLFANFTTERADWMIEDAYRYPGDIQFFGPTELTDCITNTLARES